MPKYNLLPFMAAILCFLLVGNRAFPFHEGGVGECSGCHTMHNTKSGTVVGSGEKVSRWLVPGTDPSSICLNCHAGPGAPDSYSVASPTGSAMSPGGDFYWLTKTFSWDNGVSLGERHGHNIIATDFGFTQDITNGESPGGSYKASDLGCNSCHEPHGKVQGGTEKGIPPVAATGSYGGVSPSGHILGNYRLLGDSGYGGGSQAAGYGFTRDAPIARQNSDKKYGETDASHVDYGSGMSEWCGNCHQGYLVNDHSVFEHPSGSGTHLETEMLVTYNSYVKTGDLSGNESTSYLALVPFERGVTDRALLDPTSTRGPDSRSNVMCLSCHRAHASAFPYIGRWDFSPVFIANSHPATGDIGVTGNDVLYSYYGRDLVATFGSGQKQFCEKCHGQ